MQMHAAAEDSCADGNSYIRGGSNQWGGCCKKKEASIKRKQAYVNRCWLCSNLDANLDAFWSCHSASVSYGRGVQNNIP